MPIVRRPNFIISKKLYAIDPESFTVTEYHRLADENHVTWRYEIDARWFSKRSNGRIGAFFGELTCISSNRNGGEMWTFKEFMDNYDSARYGGTAFGAWDGQGTWWDSDYANDLEAQNEILPSLKETLDNKPAVPKGYEGWYMLTEF